MTLIKNLTNSVGKKLHILIDGEYITEVYYGDPENLPVAENVFDFQDKYVFNGLVDPHVHMRTPGFTYKEDFITGSRACAKGGITAFMDMPNTNPPVISIKELEEKRDILKKGCNVNYGLYFGGSRQNNSDEVSKVLEKEKHIFLKIFLNASTGNMLVEDENVLKELFSSGQTIFVHAEEQAMQKAIDMAFETDRNLYVCHVATKNELDIIRQGRKRLEQSKSDKKIYAEVTPHHLFLTVDDQNKTEEKQKLYSMKPSLKTTQDVSALWEAIKNNEIDTIGTDHAPHLLGEKIEKTTFGVPGVETSLGLMLTAHKDGRISLEEIEKLMSTNPASIFGLGEYGAIKKGNKANLTVFDFRNWYLSDFDLESKSKWSPFEGTQLKAKNYATFVNGKLVYKDNIFYNENCGEELKYE